MLGFETFEPHHRRDQDDVKTCNSPSMGFGIVKRVGVLTGPWPAFVWAQTVKSYAVSV